MTDFWFFVKLTVALYLVLNVVVLVVDRHGGGAYGDNTEAHDLGLLVLTPVYWAWFITFSLN